MKKSFVYPVIFMTLLTAVFTFVLAYLEFSTAEKVASLQEIELQQKILYVFDIKVPSTNPDDINKIFNENIETEEIDEKKIYRKMDNGEVVGYAIPAGGPGLWGLIDAYIGISSDYSEILGIEFISHSETPGLGGRISEEGYKEQFRGIDISNVNDNNFIIYRPAPGGNIDAIAGATLTSKSVSNFLNEDLSTFIKEKGGTR